MTHIAGEGRLSDGWKGGARQPRPVALVILLVCFTAAGVFVARQAISFQSPVAALAWLICALLLVLARIRWLRGLGRQPAGVVFTDARREGTSAPVDARRHRRFVPARRATTLHLQDGRQIPARIVDISIAGVAVEARLTDLDMMAVRRVGMRAAGPVRRTPTGAVFGFEVLLDPKPFDASFVL